MGVTSGSLDGENTALDVKKRDIESTTAQIVDQDVALLLGLSRAQTVGNSGSSRLVNDTKDVEASNSTSILGSLTLIVVEVGRNSDDGLLDLLTELGLGNLLHLWELLAQACPSNLARDTKPRSRAVWKTYLGEDHGRDLLGRELLLLAEVLDLDLGLASIIKDGERPGLNILLDGGVIVAATDQTPEGHVSI